MAPPRPRYCVWEITLACDARCVHCGSFAGPARREELTTEEALDAVDQLADLGCRSVTLSGGEPLMRADWPAIAGGIVERGMRLEMISNGLAVEAQADTLAAAGFFAVSMSVDGPPALHDELRGVEGGFDALTRGAQALRERGVRIGAVTQVNRRNLPYLDEVHDLLIEHGFAGWQLQLTLAHGRAGSVVQGEEPICLEPEQLPELERKMMALLDRGQIFIHAADSIGYLGRGENRIRSGTGRDGNIWAGCQAGIQVIGLTSDGRVRGCLSLPPTFDEGNIRERRLADLWADPSCFAFTRRFEPTTLTGVCAGCELGRICRGGCTSLAVSATGSVGDNPYCLRRLMREGAGAAQ